MAKTNNETQAKVVSREDGIQSDGSFHFNLELVEIPVSLRTADGVNKTYGLREFTGKQRDAFVNLISSKTRIGSDGKPAGIKNVDGMQASILTRTLFDKTEDRFVTVEEVDNMPQRVLDKLCDWVLEKSGLDDKSKDKAKNDDAESTTSGDD